MVNIQKNTIAILLILALVFAGIGMGIAINNYIGIEGQFTEVPATIIKDEASGEVIINIVPPGKGEEREVSEP